MLSLLQGGYYWVSKGSLNTVTHCVCSRSLVVTTWSLYLNKWSEHVIRKGWRKNAAQVTPRTQVVRINKAECGGIVTPVKCLTLMEWLCLVLFAEDNSESKLQAINTDFTFELFICAAILLENRESLLQCRDEVQLIQFTSRFVRMIRHENPITREGIWMDMNVLVKPLPFFCAAFREHWIWTAHLRKQSTICTTTASAALGTIWMATAEHTRAKERTFFISSAICLF